MKRIEFTTWKRLQELQGYVSELRLLLGELHDEAGVYARHQGEAWEYSTTGADYESWMGTLSEAFESALETEDAAQSIEQESGT